MQAEPPAWPMSCFHLMEILNGNPEPDGPGLDPAVGTLGIPACHTLNASLENLRKSQKERER